MIEWIIVVSYAVLAAITWWIWRRLHPFLRYQGESEYRAVTGPRWDVLEKEEVDPAGHRWLTRFKAAMLLCKLLWVPAILCLGDIVLRGS